MGKKRNKTRVRHGLQGITLCISTALVLILLGMVVFSVFTAHNLSAYVKENLTVTMMLGEDITNPEARQLCNDLKKRPYISHLTYISKEQALKEQTEAMGTDPSEFLGTNPFVASIELQLKAQYANSDSLKWISKDLKRDSKVTDITYPQDLMDSVNTNLQKINHGVARAGRAAHVRVVLAYQQHCKAWRICAPLYYSYHEARRSLMGIHPQTFPL